MAASSGPSQWQDWAVPTVLLVGAQYETWLPGVTRVSGPRLLFGVVATLAAGLLVVRRRHPLIAVMGICALMLVPMAFGWFIQSLSMVLIGGVSLFGAGRYAERPAAYVAVPVTAFVVVVTAFVDPALAKDRVDSMSWSLNTVWVFAVGAAFRHERVLRDRVAAGVVAASRVEAAEERVRVARDLHDALSHSLSVVVIQAEVADAYLDSDQDRAREAIRRVAATARDTMSDTRRIVGLLREPDEAEPRAANLGVGDLPALVERIREAGVPVTLELSKDLPALSAQGTVTAYRVVQESLTNVLRHAGKAPTHVRLAPVDGRVVIDVWDTGSDVNEPTSPGGMGLVGMRERVRACGGELTSGPASDGGFRVRAVLPAADNP
ncbi:MAG: sensor histidine kinase [Knoellia sp.]